MLSVYFKFLKHFYGELMPTNHNSVCHINIDLIIIFTCFLIFYKKQNLFVRWTSLYMLLFSIFWLTCLNTSYIVLIFTTQVIPLWQTSLCRIPIENFICICCSNLIRISNYWLFLLLFSYCFTCILSFAGKAKVSY